MRDADAHLRLSATVAGTALGAVFVFIGGLVGWMLGARGLMLVLTALLAGVLAGVLVRQLALAVADGAGRGFLAFLQPSGRSTPYESEFSQAQALAAAGDVDGAMALYHEEMVRLPGNVPVRLQCADLHARCGQPDRAEALFLEARRLASSRDQELYCTQRLIDLRLGPLGQPVRALPELRRIIERFPGTREAAGAREALARLKRELPLES